MKILVVQPKSSGFMGQISKSGKAGFARVTLTTLAALNPAENEVRIHDARLSEPDYHEDWDLVGFTGMTCEIPHVYRMADLFRKQGKTVVIGGYHASALPEEALEHSDFVVVGEAEGILQQILKEMGISDRRQRVTYMHGTKVQYLFGIPPAKFSHVLVVYPVSLWEMEEKSGA